MAFTRPVVGADISAADFGQPVYDLLTPTPWTVPPLQNSWVGYSVLPAYRKVGDIVEMRGTVNGGANTTVIFTLPPGFRPPGNIDVISYHWPGQPDSCFLSVLTNGNVSVSGLRGATTVQYVSLAQIRFSITP